MCVCLVTVICVVFAKNRPSSQKPFRRQCSGVKCKIYVSSNAVVGASEGTLTTISRIKYYYARRTKNAKLAPRRPDPSSWGRSTATLQWRWRLLPFCCTPSRLDRVSTPTPPYHPYKSPPSFVRKRVAWTQNPFWGNLRVTSDVCARTNAHWRTFLFFETQFISIM